MSPTDPTSFPLPAPGVGATGHVGAPPRPSAPAPGPGGAGGAQKSFADVLAEVSPGRAGEAGELRFSRHALQRVQRRGIALDPSTLGRLQEGVRKAAGKGSRDSVVLVDGAAFVVSVSNKTVLTAVLPEHMREQVFTNIDSAVIA